MTHYCYLIGSGVKGPFNNITDARAEAKPGDQMVWMTKEHAESEYGVG